MLFNTIFQFQKKLREESDELSEFKKKGRAALPDTLQSNFDVLWDKCASIGLFIVTVGELGFWLVDYGLGRLSKKSKWISTALDKVFGIEHDEDKAIWKFVDALKTFFD